LKTNSSILLKLFTRKVALVTLLGASVAAFASLGDGKSSGGGKSSSKSSLLSSKKSLPPGAFSLKSGYSFRNIQVTKADKDNFINLNTVVTYQKGNSTYILPLKKKVLLNNKITFNPNSDTRN